MRQAERQMSKEKIKWTTEQRDSQVKERQTDNMAEKDKRVRKQSIEQEDMMQSKKRTKKKRDLNEDEVQSTSARLVIEEAK